MRPCLPGAGSVNGQPDFDKALQVTVTGQPSSPGLDGEYSLGVGVPSAQPRGQRFELPVRMAADYAAGQVRINFWPGYGPQVLQIAGVSVQRYGPGTPAGRPQATYAGREPGASWRAAADDRIERSARATSTSRSSTPRATSSPAPPSRRT
ncbi:hypothetical protein AB0K16_10280 [Nonomuraea jabiensis]|uniref:hypothetical protein n=1 Tax=Nonomuraea jabiensis TaxID=882448 RepID=UPI00343CE21A